MNIIKLLLTGFLILILINLNSQITTPIPKISGLEVELIKFIEDPILKNASIGFYAINLETGGVIAEYNSDMSLVPASTLKLVTTATALEMFGKNFRFKTTIQYNGTIDSSGVLNGNIYVKGGGDPALGSKLFESDYYNPYFMQIWLDSLKSLGIDSINGAIIGDATIFKQNNIPATWIWGDIANYYGSPAYGISIFENYYKLNFKSGSNHGDSTIILGTEPSMPNVYFENEVWSSNVNRDNAYIYGAPYSDNRYVEGSIPKSRSEFTVKGSIPDPPFIAAFEFNNFIKSGGIGIGLPPTTLRRLNIKKDTLPRNEICITQSPTLRSIIYWTNLKSHNLFAEHLLNYIGYYKYGSGENVSGTKAVEDFWESKGVNISGMYLNDGCGLSRYNAITAKQLVDILGYMKTMSSNYEVLNKSLPIAGKTGTLSSICKGTIGEGKVRAKSGTMTRVKSYAGYVSSDKNNEIAFAIIVNNFSGSTKNLEKKIEKLFDQLAVY